jgi:hypothetical protein
VHRDALVQEVPVERLEVLGALDLPGDVEETHLPGLRRRRVRPHPPQREVVGVLVPRYAEEDHPPGEAAGDAEADDVGVEGLRPVEVADLEDDVAELLQCHDELLAWVRVTRG